MKRKSELCSPFDNKIGEKLVNVLTKEQVGAPSICLDFRKTGKQIQNTELIRREVLEENTKSLHAPLNIHNTYTVYETHSSIQERDW